jgi:hypothetical protein
MGNSIQTFLLSSLNNLQLGGKYRICTIHMKEYKNESGKWTC